MAELGDWELSTAQEGWIQAKVGEATGADTHGERVPCDHRRLVSLPSIRPSCEPSGPDLLGTRLIALPREQAGSLF